MLFAAACATTALSACAAPAPQRFPAFTAADFSGNVVNESVLRENAVTVVNIWFTGCGACVRELQSLEEISQKLGEKGGSVLGICVDATEEETRELAKAILEKKGVKYKNLSIEEGSEAEKYLHSVTAFPTTLLLDQEGNIVGDPIVGSIDTAQRTDALLRRVDAIVSKTAETAQMTEGESAERE